MSIRVYLIENKDGRKYYDKSIEGITAIINEAEPNETFKVTILVMETEKYHQIPAAAHPFE